MIEIRNQKSFERSLDSFAKSLGVEVVVVVKKLAFDIFADVVGGTPVLTGRAMNNWNISVGSKDLSTRETGGNKGSLLGAKKTEAGAALSGLKPFSTVWITNNLPYIIELEEGHSKKQAPRGWIAVAVQRNLALLSRVAI